MRLLIKHLNVKFVIIVKNYIVLGLFFILLFIAYPYVFCRFISLPDFKLTYLIAFLCLLFFFAHKKIKAFPKQFWIMCYLQGLCWILFCFYHNDTSYLTRVFYMLLTVMMLQFVEVEVGLCALIKSYNRWVLFMALGGTITFFIVFFIGITPFSIFTNQDGRPAYFFGLTCTNTYLGNIIRYSGFFDEPGAMANWGVFALIFNKLFFNNRKFETLLVICLCFTFSMAFYIQIVLYYVLYYGGNIRRLFTVSLILILLGCVTFHLIDKDSDIYQLTYARFEFDPMNGDIKGNSRSELTEKAKAQFLKAPIMGIGAEALGKIEYMDDNPFETLAKDGVVGTIFMYLPLVFILYYSKRDRNVWIAIIILSLGYLQRPYHIDLIHPTMLYTLLLLVLYNCSKTSYRNLTVN